MKLAKKYRTRLIRLADKLEGVGPYVKVGPVPVRKFDLTFYVNGNDPNECGFAGCACGWAASDPWFQKRGLGILLDEFGDNEFWFGRDTLEEAAAWDALFTPEAYRAGDRTRPATVAKRIRKLVEDTTPATQAERGE